MHNTLVIKCTIVNVLKYLRIIWTRATRYRPLHESVRIVGVQVFLRSIEVSRAQFRG